MSSTDDILQPQSPTTGAVQNLVRDQGGVIGYWEEQLLLAPKTARALGERDGYVRVKALAVPIVAETATKRRIYLQVLVPLALARRARWIGLDAFDVQNPCVEGHRLS